MDYRSDLIKAVKKILIANINKINFKSLKGVDDTDTLTDVLYLDFAEFQAVLNNFNTTTFYKKLNNIDFVGEVFKILDYQYYNIDKELIKFLFIKNNDYKDIIDRCLYIIYNEILYNIIDITLNNIDNSIITNKKQLIAVIKNL